MADPLDADITRAWPVSLALAELGRQPREERLIADEEVRARIARALGLVELKALDAQLEITPWLDGARIAGRWSATVVQTCGVTLEPFESALTGEIDLKALPTGSPALAEDPGVEVELDPAAEDPPEAVLDGRLPLGAYVAEDLALSLDPFPRKPGAAFEPPPAGVEPAPFAALARLKGRLGER